MTNKLYGLLGLSEKAGKVSSGEFSCEKSIHQGKTKLCIIAEDSSENTKKHFSDMCHFRKIPVADGLLTKEELGKAIGKKERAVICIEDAGFAAGLSKIIEGGK